MVKLHEHDVKKIADKIDDMFRRENLQSVYFDADHQEIIWLDSWKTYAMLDYYDGTFTILSGKPDVNELILMHGISDEALIKFAKNYGIIEFDEDGCKYVLLPKTDEEN